MIPEILAAADTVPPMNWGIIVAICAFTLNTVTVVVGATWGVSKLRESSALISQSVDHLQQAVSKLDKSMAEVYDRTHNQGERIARLEGRK